MEHDKLYTVYSSSLLYYNFPFQPGKAQPAEHHLPIADLVRISGIQDSPVYSYQANGKIHHLDELHHPESELEFLRGQTLHIYLYEPLCCYLPNDPDQLYDDCENIPFNCGFYSEFNPGTESLQRSLELDSIQKYAQQNGLTDVVVHTGDYGVEIYADQYPELKLICDDAFLNTLMVFSDVLFDKKDITTRFISTNWRFTPSRAIVSALLANKSCNLVWTFHVDKSIIMDAVWMRPDAEFVKPMATGLRLLNTGENRCLDIKVDKKHRIELCAASEYPAGTLETLGNPVALNNKQYHLKEYYRTTFVDVVTESRYAQPTANVSEKVMQSIQFRTPFIMVAPPYSLQYLRDLGFWTFNQWWDESYDTETDHVKRMEKIYAVIQQISQMSDSEINTMYAEMKGVVDHNLHNLVTNRTIPGEYVIREYYDIPDAKLSQWQT